MSIYTRLHSEVVCVCARVCVCICVWLCGVTTHSSFPLIYHTVLVDKFLKPPSVKSKNKWGERDRNITPSPPHPPKKIGHDQFVTWGAYGRKEVHGELGDIERDGDPIQCARLDFFF